MDDSQPVVGVAFSGGGIRSATFVLGFCQGLAQLIGDDKKPGLLRRVDVMSTVSGGGYFGAFLGALFTRQKARGEVEARLNDSFSRPVQWLRENGRYLAPNGSGDSLLAASVVLRNWTAVTVVMSTAVLTLLTTAHLGRIGARSLLERYAEGTPVGRLVAEAVSVAAPRFAIYWSAYIFPAAIVFTFVVVPLGWAYWLGRWSKNLEHQWVWGYDDGGRGGCNCRRGVRRRVGLSLGDRPARSRRQRNAHRRGRVELDGSIERGRSVW